MFNTKIPKSSESWTGKGKPTVSETYEKTARPSGDWQGVKLETAPSSNLADIAEADAVKVDDTNSLPNALE